MTLDEIAAAWTPANAPTVPAWALGTVRRRSITFATGVEDTATRVIWVQAHALTGDVRIHPGRSRLEPGHPLATLDRETLARLASVEGGVAATFWSEPVMSWDGWIGFQPYDKYPEPGILRRTGDCMIEFAPSGVYVEDWRFQASAPGLLAGLRLEAEEDEHGTVRARAGGLVVAGDHAIRVLARRDELPAGVRAQDFVRNSADPVAALERVFDCVAEHLVRDGGTFAVDASTDPRREGLRGALLGDLARGPDPDVVLENVTGTPGVRRRRWRILSLEADHVFELATDAPAERLAWLRAEADTLLDPIMPTNPRMVRCA